ncbi:uncharacterized protein JCM15063_006389 [Sporobolomyces koalae]|uniref:uncharacterized protein n=1 Tax=Sporobolomyces koalae TaxID=500713 RepID=UPI0031707CCB
MPFKLTSLLTLLAAVSTTLAAPVLETRNPGSAYCSPYNLNSSSKAEIAVDSSGKYDWILQYDSLNRVQNVQVGGSNGTSSSIFGFSSTTDGANESYRFSRGYIDNVEYCISARSASEIRDAPCDSALAEWTLTCASCGYDGHGDSCIIQSTAFGTCAILEENGVGLGECPPFTVNSGAYYKGNDIWAIVPK